MAHSAKRKRLASKKAQTRPIGFCEKRGCYIYLTSTGKRQYRYKGKRPDTRQKALSKVVTGHYARNGMI